MRAPRPKRPRRVVSWLLVIAGLGVVAAGAALVYTPAGVLAAGAALVLVGLFAVDVEA